MFNTKSYDREKRVNIYSLIAWNIILVLIILLIRSNAFGQYHKPPPKLSVLLKNWSVNINGGQTSFYGEVSLHDDELSEKLSKEGSWAYGFVISRQMTPIFGLSGQMIWGSLYGADTRSQFHSDIMEYTFNTTVNFVNLLMPENDARFFLYGKLGFGQFRFKTTLIFDEPDKPEKKVESESPEFLYLVGGGAYYKISHALEVNAEATVRLIDNDKIDGTVNNKDDNDYYTYISLGITYNINNKPRDTRYYKKLGMKSPLIRRK